MRCARTSALAGEYYLQRGATLIVMVGGGEKSTQKADIAKAIRLAGTLED